MQSKAMQKLVYKDGETVKAITCEIISEDSFFMTVKAAFTGKEIRIGKGFIVSIKGV